MTLTQLKDIEDHQKYLLNFKTSYGPRELQLIGTDVSNLLSYISKLAEKIGRLELAERAVVNKYDLYSAGEIERFEFEEAVDNFDSIRLDKKVRDRNED